MKLQKSTDNTMLVKGTDSVTMAVVSPEHTGADTADCKLVMLPVKVKKCHNIT